MYPERVHAVQSSAWRGSMLIMLRYTVGRVAGFGWWMAAWRRGTCRPAPRRVLASPPFVVRGDRGGQAGPKPLAWITVNTFEPSHLNDEGPWNRW